MGIEYQAVEGKTIIPEVISQVFSEMASQPEWEALRSESNSMSFGYAYQRKHPDWQEDVELEIKENSIYVLFHSGTAMVREMFLSRLAKILESHGIFCEFEEI